MHITMDTTNVGVTGNYTPHQSFGYIIKCRTEDNFCPLPNLLCASNWYGTIRTWCNLQSPTALLPCPIYTKHTQKKRTHV